MSYNAQDGLLYLRRSDGQLIRRLIEIADDVGWGCSCDKGQPTCSECVRRIEIADIVEKLRENPVLLP